MNHLAIGVKLILSVYIYYFQTTTEESFLENISNVLLPFLSRCENLIPNSRDELLNNYLKHLSKYDLNLPLMVSIFQKKLNLSSSSELSFSKLFSCLSFSFTFLINTSKICSSAIKEFWKWDY